MNKGGSDALTAVIRQNLNPFQDQLTDIRVKICNTTGNGNTCHSVLDQNPQIGAVDRRPGPAKYLLPIDLAVGIGGVDNGGNLIGIDRRGGRDAIIGGQDGWVYVSEVMA